MCVRGVDGVSCWCVVMADMVLEEPKSSMSLCLAPFTSLTLVSTVRCRDSQSCWVFQMDPVTICHLLCIIIDPLSVSSSYTVTSPFCPFSGVNVATARSLLLPAQCNFSPSVYFHLVSIFKSELCGPGVLKHTVTVFPFLLSTHSQLLLMIVGFLSLFILVDLFLKK